MDPLVAHGWRHNSFYRIGFSQNKITLEIGNTLGWSIDIELYSILFNFLLLLVDASINVGERSFLVSC